MKSIEVEPAKAAAQNFPGYQAGACESETVRKIEQSIAYMMQHLDESLQVATLAAQANISASHFFALFKRQTGCAPIGCFIRLRMQHACRLLDETVMSVKEIAATLGYDDPFYFSRFSNPAITSRPANTGCLKMGPSQRSGIAGLPGAFFNRPNDKRVWNVPVWIRHKTGKGPEAGWESMSWQHPVTEMGENTDANLAVPSSHVALLM
jgi:AraC-like DNA-binding protein